MRAIRSFVFLLVPFALACVHNREVTVEQVPTLAKIGDVMDAQATVADPQFKKRDQASFTDAEYAVLADVSAKIQATALKTKDFSKGPGFDALAVQLHDRAAELGTAAVAKDAAGARKALTDMKKTCKECHSKFR
jgi:hypothetical protein